MKAIFQISYDEETQPGQFDTLTKNVGEVEIQEGQPPTWLSGNKQSFYDEISDYSREFADGKFNDTRIADWMLVPELINRSRAWVIIEE